MKFLVCVCVCVVLMHRHVYRYESVMENAPYEDRRAEAINPHEKEALSVTFYNLFATRKHIIWIRFTDIQFLPIMNSTKITY